MCEESACACPYILPCILTCILTSILTYRHCHKQTNERTNKRTNEQTNERTNEQTNKRTNEQTNEQGDEIMCEESACLFQRTSRDFTKLIERMANQVHNTHIRKPYQHPIHTAYPHILTLTLTLTLTHNGVRTLTHTHTHTPLFHVPWPTSVNSIWSKATVSVGR